MYKKLHTSEKEPLAEPYCRKGSFACLVPLRVIMLTIIVQSIHNAFEWFSYIIKQYEMIYISYNYEGNKSLWKK